MCCLQLSGNDLAAGNGWPRRVHQKALSARGFFSLALSGYRLLNLAGNSWGFYGRRLQQGRYDLRLGSQWSHRFGAAYRVASPLFCRAVSSDD